MSSSPALEIGGRAAPAGYSSVAEECQVLTEGVGLLDRSYIGRLSISGEDGLDLLNRLSTNKLMDLAPGRGMPTVLTSNKGRIIDVLFVLRWADQLLVVTAAESRQKVADWIEFYTFAEDVAVRDVTEETSMLALAGPKAASVLDAVTGVKVSDLERYGSLQADVGSTEATVIRSDFAGVPGYDLVIPSGEKPRLWEVLLEQGEKSGVAPVGLDAADVVSVELGVPRYGHELSEEFNPLEANLVDFISFDKGCYVGQEVVARLDTYKKVQKHLVGLVLDSVADPPSGAKILQDGKQAGVITSSVRSPRLNKRIALGYVRTAHSLPGTTLSLESEDGDISAEVVDLPFTR